MFKTEISSSPMMNEPANTLMNNIRGDRFMGDCSFIVTMRSLLYNRVPKDESIIFKVSRSDYTAEDVGRTRKRDMVKNICNHNGQIGNKGTFALHYFSNMNNAYNTACFNVIAEEFENTYPGYKKLELITVFYKKAFPVVCFINEELKSVALFVEQMDYRRFHYLQCAILPMVPWYFDKAAGITPEEKALVESLAGNSPDVYKDCVAKIYETFDFRSELIRQQLGGFELRFIKDALDASEGQYRDIAARIADFNRRLDEELAKMTDMNFRISGMRQKLEEGKDDDSEIMEYFLRNKNLSLISCSGSRIDFIVRTKLEYFDPEMAEGAINNNNSLLYTRGGRVGREDRKMLYKAIFLDGTISINVCAAFQLSIGGGVNARGHYNFGEDFNNCMPHPHIDEYSCMGDYTRIINELMQRHDYIMALEQCIASARSLNFADSTVLGYFIRVLMDEDDRARCLGLPDGRIVKPSEAVKWLKEKKADAK